MHFFSSIAFDFKTPSFIAFTLTHNKKCHATKARQTRYIVMPVKANLDTKTFSPLTHHLFEKTKRPRVRGCYVLML